MKLKRLKGAKGLKWKKGQSCLSNARNTYHRDATRGNFFQVIEGEKVLTAEALAKHTAELEAGAKLSADPEDDKSIGRSFNTFATNFTTCTIPAFERFFKNFSVESELQTRMLSIHAAAQEYIQNEKLTESSTSYMCTLMVSLEGVKDSEEDVTATLSLIAKVIRKVCREVLKAKFAEYSKLFDHIFISFANTSNSKLLINIIGCLSILLRAQDEVQWSYSSTKNLFQKIISFTTHDNSDVRRTAQYNASAILKASSFMLPEELAPKGEEYDEEEGSEKVLPSPFQEHPVADSCGKFVITNLRLASESMNGKATVHLLVFLQQIISCLPTKTLEQCCSLLLGIMHIGNDVVNSRALKVLIALFTPMSLNGQSRRSSALTACTNEALLNALSSTGENSKQTLRLIPSINDADLSALWMDAGAAGIIHLVSLDTSLGILQASLWIMHMTNFWKSLSEQVHEKVWYTIDYLFDECIIPLKEHIPDHLTPLLEAFKCVKKCLSLQMESAWPYIFSSLVPFFTVLGPYTPSDNASCLKDLSNLINTPNLKGRKQLENAVGAAIVSMGPEEVLKVIPVQITGNISDDETGFWILPILKRHVKKARLCFFKTYFMHLADKCFILLERLKEQDKLDSLFGKSYQVVERQIWSLLCSFSDEPVDIEEAMTKDFVALICDHLKKRQDIRMDIMSALRKMLAGSSKTSSLAMYHGKELLPTLFAIYLMKPREKFGEKSGQNLIDNCQRLAALSTIEAFFCILRKDKFPVFFQKLLDKLDSDSCDPFTQRSLLSLAKYFVPYLQGPLLDVIYERAQSGVKSANKNIQKASYKIIEELFSSDSDACKLYLKEHLNSIRILLVSSTRFLIISSRASRLNCLTKFLSYLSVEILQPKMKKLLKQSVAEAVKYCSRENSKAARKASFTLFSEVGRLIQINMKLSAEETFHHCFSLLPPLLPVSESSVNTILALMALFHQYLVFIPPSTLNETLEDVLCVLTSGEKSVLQTSLGFIQMMFKMVPIPVMSGQVDIVIKTILSLPTKELNKVRLKIRYMLSYLIRKFGPDRIRALVPEKHLLRKTVTNLVKIENRRRRNNKQKPQDQDENPKGRTLITSLDEVLDEIDREIEDDSQPLKSKSKRLLSKRTMKKKTWIMEDKDEIVDLLDASAGERITKMEPKRKKIRFEDESAPPLTEEEKYGFKIDPKTKKFIITDEFHNPTLEKNNNSDESDVDLPEIFIRGDSKSNQPQSGKRKRIDSEASVKSYQTSARMSGWSTVASDTRSQKMHKFDYGGEFRAKRAGGDITKKGGVQPYAYVQFSKDKLNKRKKAKYAGQFKSLVRGAKKGIARGSKRAKKK